MIHFENTYKNVAGEVTETNYTGNKPKYITVKLTQDQADTIKHVLIDYEADHYETMTQEYNAFIFRLIAKINAELVK